MNKEARIAVYKAALEIGCCIRCALRYSAVDEPLVNFDSPNEFASKTWGLKSDEDDEPCSKKVKDNPCIVCLDALSDSTLADMVQFGQLNNILGYDCETFINYISFPSCVLMREHSLGIYFREKYEQFFEELVVIPMNRAWNLSIKEKLAKAINKKFDRNSNLIIQFNLSYNSENEELAVLSNLGGTFKQKSDRLSRGVLMEHLKKVDKELFKNYVDVPPKIPSEGLMIKEVTVHHDPIYIAGRYCKYCRALGQTPWVIDNVKKFETSVQDQIFEPLYDLFKCRNLVFSSSGREDFDVRTLGRGRPFFIKITDSKRTKITFNEFRDVEKNINQSKSISVKHLQLIDKKDVTQIKEGEETKKKKYRALCIVENPEKLQEYLEKINSLTTFSLEQSTPIRVYHRRSKGDRKKEIYSIEARAIPGRPNLFELDIVTQAGTYVKEFVHGDFGRTRPSLAKIIEGKVDILALDVLDIMLDFPPPINYE